MSSSQEASTSKLLGWRPEVSQNSSSRLISMRTRRPPTILQTQALSGS